MQLTADSSNDHSPVWLADGKTILFVRESANSRTLCTVGEHGGPVSELAILPDGFIHIECVAPNRRSLVYLVRDPEWKLILFEIAAKQQRDLGIGSATAWSPDSQRLYVSMWGESEQSARILNLATGSQLPLTGDLRAAAWLDDNTLVADKFTKVGSEQARLVVMHADGVIEREVLLPFSWDDENDELSPFADKLVAIPGNSGSILYGRHAGNSTEGDAQVFYLVSLKGGQPAVTASGRDLAWSSDNKFFVTGEGRHLETLDPKGNVWVSSLSVVSLANGETRKLVHGLVSVGGFDWQQRPR
ncbi:MAG: PD40 domain-containing protein [Deltaproteobacteria bacterium]|nr:PD40 domain-containing protein [Deltaproteobacteria bacterium]